MRPLAGKAVLLIGLATMLVIATSCGSNSARATRANVVNAFHAQGIDLVPLFSVTRIGTVSGPSPRFPTGTYIEPIGEFASALAPRKPRAALTVNLFSDRAQAGRRLHAFLTARQHAKTLEPTLRSSSILVRGNVIVLFNKEAGGAQLLKAVRRALSDLPAG